VLAPKIVMCQPARGHGPVGYSNRVTIGLCYCSNTYCIMLQEEVRPSLGSDKNKIDLVSYPCHWGAAAAVGEAAPLEFRASYPRFMTIGIM
jgi:hypothetical protein